MPLLDRPLILSHVPETGANLSDSLTITTQFASPIPPRASILSPPSIPDYELLRLIGQGSYGQVWLACSATGALRAIKVVYRASFDHERPYEREFEGIKKFEPVSQARETQVAIFHVGRNDTAGFFYYVMELADDASHLAVASAESGGARLLPSRNVGQRDKKLDGSLTPLAAHPLSPPRGEGQGEGCWSNPSRTSQSEIKAATGSYPSSPPFADSASFAVENYFPHTLKHSLKSGPLPLPTVLSIAESLATALDHLHSHGLVHRDIKPSNIIFVNGRPKLADIGLVTSTDATRSFVGTDGYIPPEGPGTPQADLYSLGKVLYECVTGKDRTEFPELPDDWRTSPQRRRLLELNEVTVKACDGDPRQRYESVAAMCADLALLQYGQSIKRKHKRNQRLNHARKFAVAVGTVATMSLCFYLPIALVRPPAFVWSKVPEANDEYRSGKASLHTSFNGGSEQAVEHFQRAIALDSRFAAAYVGLAQAYFFIGGPGPERIAKARSAAETALALNPRMAEAHAMLGSVAVRLDLDWHKADKELKYALELNSNSPDVLYTCALNFAVMGRKDEALKMLAKAIREDPVSASVTRLRHAAHIFRWTRQYDRAIKAYEQVIEKAPSSRVNMEVFLGEVYLGKGDYLGSIRLERSAALLAGRKPSEVNQLYDDLEAAFNEGGSEGYWRKRLESELSKTDQEHLMRLAAIFARLNQGDRAFPLLKQAFRDTPTEFAFRINTDSSFDSVRSDPRFPGLVSELWRKS